MMMMILYLFKDLISNILYACEFMKVQHMHHVFSTIVASLPLLTPGYAECPGPSPFSGYSCVFRVAT